MLSFLYDACQYGPVLNKTYDLETYLQKNLAALVFVYILFTILFSKSCPVVEW